jgi:hypothetical protein
MRRRRRGPTSRRCRGCGVKLPTLSLNHRGFCSKPYCQGQCNRLMAKAFSNAERIHVAPLLPPPAKVLPPPIEPPSPLPRMTRQQQLALSALARARMVTSEGLSPE